MADHLVYKTIVLQSLVDLLRDEGIEINPAAALAIGKVVVNTDLDTVETFAKLKYRIVPILGRNKEEQEILYKVFDSLDERAITKEAGMEPPEIKETGFVFSPKKEEENWFHRLKRNTKTRWAAAGILLLTAVLIFLLIKPPPPPSLSVRQLQIEADKSTIIVGDTVRFAANTSDTAGQAATTVRWHFPDGDTVLPLQVPVLKVPDQPGEYEVKAVPVESSAGGMDSAFFAVSVLCEPPPSVSIRKLPATLAGGEVAVRKNQYAPQFTNPSNDSAGYKYNWYVNGQRVSGEKVFTYKSKTIGNNEIKLVVDSRGLHCSADSLVYSINERAPITVAIAGGEPLRINKSFNWQLLDKALFWLLLLIVLPSLVIYRFLKPVRKKEKKSEPVTEPEEPFSIQFKNQEHTISTEKEIYQLADLLRKRHVSDVYKLNIRKTITATVRSGGLPTLAFVPLTQPSDYLVFIERQNDDSHLERLFKFLVAKLENEQVNLTVYEYRKEPLFLSNERLNHSRIPIDKIAALYTGKTLLIFGDTRHFSLPLKGTLKSWVTEKLGAWKTKIIVTPLPKNDWDKKEQQLIEAGFTVIPADLNANPIIEKIINNTVENQADATFQIPATYSTRLYNFQELDALKEYLRNENLLRWVCSLAVFRTIDWNLTLAIGKKLESALAEKGKPAELVNYTNLLKLGRITWLQDGMLSDSLRIDMLKYLDNETEKLARQALVEQLTELESTITPASLIKKEFAVHKRVNAFLLNVYEKKSPSKKEEAFIREVLAENQLDQANEIYLNSDNDTLLKHPFKKGKNVNLKQYFRAVALRRKAVAVAAALFALVLFIFVLQQKAGNDYWIRVLPSELSFVVQGGKTTTEDLVATLYAGDSVATVSLEKDSLLNTQVLLQDTTTKALLTITTSAGQLLTQDSFLLNAKNYTVQLTESVPTPLTIFYKNATDLSLANALEESLPTKFDITIGQQNFSDTALRILYASAEQQKDAETVGAIAGRILGRKAGLVRASNAVIQSINGRDTVFQPQPISVYLTGKEIVQDSVGELVYKPLFSAKSHSVQYAVQNNKLVLSILSRNSSPSVEFDVNQNRQIDANVDRAYGIAGTSVADICTQYLKDEITSTVCGAAKSGATLTKANNEYKFTIPLNEIKTPGKRSVYLRFSFYNQRTGSVSIPQSDRFHDFRQVYAIPVDGSAGRPVIVGNVEDGSSAVNDSLSTPLSTKTFTPELRNEYQRLYDQCEINQPRAYDIDEVVYKISNNRARYEAVSKSTGVPWYFIGILHNLEAGLRFDRHLHNGDPLTNFTVNVPKGRPVTRKNPPFTWEESAEDALRLAKLDTWTDWSIPAMLYKLEQSNGFGYRRYGINSPYVWAGSNLYTKGKYTTDGRFDPNAVSQLIGGGVLLKQMEEKGLTGDQRKGVKGEE